MPNFANCRSCNRVFDDVYRIGSCPECIDAYSKNRDFRKKLSLVRNFVKDKELAGEILTVHELAEGVGLDEAEIWIFIRMGEIDTASFDDPKVREYKLRLARRIEEEKRGARAELAEEIEKAIHGFHSRPDRKRDTG
ncbi:MAG: hypothetical protein HRF49_09835 [bacterium]|jgi:MoaA/NifB/PqqE/SkfB family radical SAM enzyme